MKRISLILLSGVLVLGIGVAIIIGVSQKPVIALSTNAKFAQYQITLSDEWTHPEPRENNEDSPIGLDDTSSYWINGDKCVVSFISFKIDTQGLPTNDFDATRFAAFGNMPTVLGSIDEKSKVKILVKSEDAYLEMLLAQTEESIGMDFNPATYNLITLTRVFVNEGGISRIFIGCPKDSNIQPESLVQEVVLTS